MKIIITLLGASLLLLLPASGLSQIYSWVDQEGIRHFSNIEPPVSAENVTVSPGVPESAATQAPADVIQPTVVLVEPENPAADEEQPAAPEPETYAPAPLYADSRTGADYENVGYRYGAHFYTGYPFGLYTSYYHKDRYRYHNRYYKDRYRYHKGRYRYHNRYYKDRYRYHYRYRNGDRHRHYRKDHHRHHPRFHKERRLYRKDSRHFLRHGYRDSHPRYRYRGYGGHGYKHGYRGYRGHGRGGYGIRIRIGK